MLNKEKPPFSLFYTFPTGSLAEVLKTCQINVVFIDSYSFLWLWQPSWNTGQWLKHNFTYTLHVFLFLCLMTQPRIIKNRQTTSAIDIDFRINRLNTDLTRTFSGICIRLYTIRVFYSSYFVLYIIIVSHEKSLIGSRTP